MRIEIGRRNYLVCLLLSHPAKIARLSGESRQRLDDINRAFNERIYSGDGAREYDRIHRYTEADQNDYPARALVDETWVGEGYGRALELGAGSGYFTTLIARHARSLVAIEPVPDIRAVLVERCRREGLAHVQVLGATALDLPAHLGEASIDSAFVIQSLHHFHNLRRVLRLTKRYVTEYRAPAFWRDERNCATHDFLTRGELRALCRQAGFADVPFEGYWISGSRRLVADPRRRFGLERTFGRLPGVRHFAAVLALTARREVERGG